MNDLSPKRTDKFKAYRARKKAAGLKQVRMWGWDISSPEFKAQLEREAAILKNAPDERDVLDFIDRAMADSLKDHPY